MDYEKLSAIGSSLFFVLMIFMAIFNFRKRAKEKRHYRETGKRLEDDN